MDGNTPESSESAVVQAYEAQGYKIERHEGVEGSAYALPKITISKGTIPLFDCKIDQVGDMVVKFRALGQRSQFIEEAVEYFDSLGEESPSPYVTGGIISVHSPKSNTHLMYSQDETRGPNSMANIEITIPRGRLHSSQEGDAVSPLIGFVQTIGGHIPKDLIPFALKYVQSSAARLEAKPTP